MKITNIYQSLINQEVNNVRELAEKGDLISAFFSVREFCNRVPSSTMQLYDFQCELAEALNNNHIVYECACKQMEIYGRMPVFDLSRTFQAFSISLLKLGKVVGLKNFLKIYHIEKDFEAFKKNFKNRATKKQWDILNPLSPLDKINLATLSLWTQQFRDGGYEQIVNSTITLHKGAKFYDELRLRKALAYIELNRAEDAIKFIQQTDEQFTDKDLLALLWAYMQDNNINAVNFYFDKVLNLASKNKIDYEFLGSIIEFLDKYSMWQELLDFVGIELNFYPVDYLLNMYSIVANYNLGNKIDYAFNLERLTILNPYNIVPVRVIQNAIELGKDTIMMNAPIDPAVEQEIVLNYQELIASLDSKDKVNEIVSSKRKMENITTYIGFLSEGVEQSQLNKIVAVDTKFETMFKNLLFIEQVRLSQKLPILNALVKSSVDRNFFLSSNYIFYFGRMLDIEFLAKYGENMTEIYSMVLDYLVSLPNNMVDVYVPLLNFCVELFCKQILSSNIALLNQKSRIASIIINLYFKLAFDTFPKSCIVTNCGVSKDDLLSFNYCSADFGIKMVDGIVYVDDQPVDLVDLFETTHADSDLKIVKKDK